MIIEKINVGKQVRITTKGSKSSDKAPSLQFEGKYLGSTMDTFVGGCAVLETFGELTKEFQGKAKRAGKGVKQITIPLVNVEKIEVVNVRKYASV